MSKILAGVLILYGVLSAAWFVALAKPSNLGAYGVFIVWMLLPYVLMVIQTAKSEHPNVNIGSVFITVVLASWALADIFYIHPDPQGAIAMFMVPPSQVVLYEIVSALGLGLLSWRAKKTQ